ncbi:Ser-Thr-rich glycosyl-phosphatidyl-inositol-anchored membrane family-domain-containing protein [Annulohypoxylon maeteangense]|uniref:Ser-Thr-rich glycosyl-phosphatidyl-inositol-anchored membrane family-domain-containing protein n=1 Tax=Annulohypoxylon maeteangense TaxID=1927788 RepID=UPI002007B8BE|nr:Ser-Thr-rich glycosyl-phosphatidyl-inositol-anchored membrane family-domain-containing protein [Annulohypoxylon maeteangense]KAI0890485.1 Ser-Thr-rich glycosyl-phosphatidyl-inositol-anchored membrane family-domain-containing protein [Annulohypoxylon maeteangense]
MRSTTVFASALAFAASAFAQTAGYAVMTSPAEGTKVASGKAFTIKWDAGKYTGQATVSLLGGATPSTLTPGPVLTTVDVTAGTFTWDVDCSLGTDKTYGIKIASVADASIFQYSFPFSIEGPSCGTESTSRSASTTAGGYPTAGSSSSSVVSSSKSSTAGYPTTSVSSAPSYPTATSVSSAVTNSTSSAVVPTYSASTIVTPSGNLSVSASYPATTIVTSATGVTPSATATTSGPAVVTGAAAANAAGSFALIGGVAFAVLAM